MPDDRDPMCIPVRLHSVRENARVTLVHAAPGAGAAPPAARFSLSADFPIGPGRIVGMRNLGHVLSDMAGGDQPDLSTQNRSDRVSNPIRAVPPASGEHTRRARLPSA